MRGLIDWMTDNRVAANLLMLLLLVGGLLSAQNTQQEVFPEFDLETVSVVVAYPGASPEEVEQGVLLSIENAVRGLDGVAEVTSTATEGSGSVIVELTSGFDTSEAKRDIETAVERIQTFPDDAEDPEISEVSRRSRVITVALAGEQRPHELQALADRLEADLVAHPDVSLVEVTGLPERELAIEVSGRDLEAYGLTLDTVAQQVGAWSMERAGGNLRGADGDLRIQVADRRVTEAAVADIAIRTDARGGVVRLGDLATVRDGYADDDVGSWLNGAPAVELTAYRVGDETPTAVASAVREVVGELQTTLPDTVEVALLGDDSEVLEGRIDLLLSNALQGLLLVAIVLALFLDLRTAFWVAAGIPIAFLGAFLVLPALGVSINMISLFALLVVLGLVVDDAIVIGEQIYHEQERVAAGDPEAAATAHEAAVRGTTRMVGPVIVAVLTTVLAFAPMLGVPGMFGKVFAIFPVVVATVLLFSLVEAFLILPAHLSHRPKEGTDAPRVVRALDGVRGRVTGALATFVDRVYTPIAERLLQHRGRTLGASLGLLAAMGGLVAGGWVPLSFFPDIAGNTLTATVQLPPGSADERVDAARRAVEAAAVAAIDEVGTAEAVDGLVATRSTGSGGSEQVQLKLYVDEELLTVTPETLQAAWADAVDPELVVDSLVFSANTGPTAGAAIDVALAHDDPVVLATAARDLSAELTRFADLTDIDSSMADASAQLDVRLSPTGEALGLSTDQIAAQVRAATLGADALREQEGRHERVVRVRLPEHERTGTADLLTLPVRLSGGDMVPLGEVATLVPTEAAAEIQREDGQRLAHVTAELAPGVASSTDLVQTLQADLLPALEEAHPGLSARMAGETEEMASSLGALIPAGAVACLAIFALLATTFRSYVQPIIVMSAIPFGIVGAVLGHGLMGLSISMVSMFGMIALAGVVVNDSLVLVDAANEFRRAGASAHDAVLQAGRRRFRPILLTSLTTFLGLLPMLLETSIQAQFLIPMAVSLAFGILLATVVVLLLVPALYLLVDDAIEAVDRLRGRYNRIQPHHQATTAPATDASYP